MDTTRMDCPNCGTPNVMLAVVDGTRRYRCSSCGEEYYTPHSCLTPPPGKEAGHSLPGSAEPRRRS